MRKIVIGSRRSKLALTQTNWVIDQLKKLDLPYEFEIKEIVTKGDKILDVTLSKVGGKGLFVKEIEQAMLDEEIDMAVHSMKDMPSELPIGLMLACTPKRVDPRDALISRDYNSLTDLPAGSVVGTSSLRRAAQILAKRPDLKIKSIRGNIDTRLAKLETEDFDAIILAAAGLERMGWTEEIVTEYLTVEDCIPAVGQGSLAIECRKGDQDLRELLENINDQITFETVTAERAFLRTLEGGCQVPIAAFAVQSGNEVTLNGLVGTPDGKTIIRGQRVGENPDDIGVLLAQDLMDRGAKDILDKVKEELDQ
jgi:hydroxymethylbilane synthase